MNEQSCKRGMGFDSRCMGWSACMCKHCRPERDRGWFRRYVSKVARREGKRQIRDGEA